MAQAKGYSVGALHPKILYPQPLAKLKEFIEGTKAIIVPEVNYNGQFANLVQQHFNGSLEHIRMNRCGGVPFMPQEILEQIEQVA